MSGSGKDYGVGKGKPPKSTQFKAGQSGNPKGRPRGRKNFATEIEEILNAPVPITENGRKRNVTSRKAALLKLRKKALEGDGRALDRILELARAHEADKADAANERKMSATEDDILARYVESQVEHRSDSQDDTASNTEGWDEQSD
jgi:hypothetical protein